MSDARRDLVCCVVLILALAVAAWGWSGNHSASFSVAALVVAAGAGLGWTTRAAGYHVVLVLAVPAVVLASREAIDGELAGPAEMYLRRRMNYADVMIGLYPDRDGYRFLKAQQMGLCRQHPRGVDGACRELGQVTLEQVRGELERAIATGVTSNGDLLRIYSEVLEEVGADRTVAERARRSLDRHHPHLRTQQAGSPRGNLKRGNGSRGVNW